MWNRRDVLQGFALAAGVAAAAAPPPDSPPELTKRLDESVRRLMDGQILQAGNPNRGGMYDSTGIAMPSSAGGIIEQLTTAYVWPESRFKGQATLVERIELAVRYLLSHMSKDGNIDLLSTNFNSAPDTGFLMHNLCTAGFVARKYNAPAIADLLKPVLLRAGEGLTKGGVHTPNHRWVICSALAQLHELYPDPRYLKRIEQWLKEGIDIDEDGQFSERSTTIYSAVCDRAFTVMAAKLQRPELLAPVRRNLDTLMYLLHANGEVVTDISRRQDRNQRATADRYWFPIRYLAVHDNNGKYEAMARLSASAGASASALLEYPELAKAVAPEPLPDNFVRRLAATGIVRVKRGLTSATLSETGDDRFFSFRRGDVVVNAVRFASAFFGKGQFVPQRCEQQRDGGWYFEQNLEGPYYQPLDPPPSSPIVTHEEYSASRKQRRQSEVCRLRQSAMVKETATGFEVRLRAEGTDQVPLAVEVNFREGVQISGCETHQGTLALTGNTAFATAGGAKVTFGPGAAAHRYFQVRGALPKLDGTSVYVTGFTPFDHTLRFDWGS